MQMILVMGRVFGLIDHEILEALSAHPPVEHAGDRQDSIANLFSVELAAVHSPKVAVFRIEDQRRGLGTLAIGKARQYQPMQSFQRLTVVAKPDGQPVEQL